MSAGSTPWREDGVVFGAAGDLQVGIVTRPGTVASSDTGVVIVVGGPQYRVGSHRQFVMLARALAVQGHAVLRFDVRGMGDSAGEPRGFEALHDDIAAAVNLLQERCPTVHRFVLWGLCDGASAALLYLERTLDPRIAGIVLANPWVRSSHIQARAQVKSYYRSRLRQREFWAKLVNGEIAMRSLSGFVRALALSIGAAPRAQVSSFQQRMLDAWDRFDRPTLLLLSGRDHTAREFIEQVGTDERWRACAARPWVERVDLPDADHTFSESRERLAAEQATARWLGRQFA